MACAYFFNTEIVVNFEICCTAENCCCRFIILCDGVYTALSSSWNVESSYEIGCCRHFDMFDVLKHWNSHSPPKGAIRWWSVLQENRHHFSMAWKSHNKYPATRARRGSQLVTGQCYQFIPFNRNISPHNSLLIFSDRKTEKQTLKYSCVCH